MKILTRYILSEALSYFFIALFAFTGMLLTIRMLQFASLIINKGVSFAQIADVFISIVPTFLEIAVPMAALLGVMLAFARLSGDSEIIVIRATGISLYQLIRPLLILGLFLAACSLYISVVLAPWGNSKLASTLFNIAHSKSTAGLTAGIFNKLGPIVLYAEVINDKTGEIVRVLVDDKRQEDSRRIVIAQRGLITSDPKARNIIITLQDGYIHEEVNKSYFITDFNENHLVLNVDELYASDESGREKKGREMELPEIRQNIERYKLILDEIKEAGGNVEDLPEERRLAVQAESIASSGDVKRKMRKLQLESGRRFSMPYATFILTLLAMPLGVLPPRTQRTWGAGLSVSIGLIVFTVYYMLLSIGITFAEGGKIDPLLGLWIPNLVTTVAAAFITYKVTRENWHSVAQGVEYLLDGIINRFRKEKRQ